MNLVARGFDSPRSPHRNGLLLRFGVEEVQDTTAYGRRLTPFELLRVQHIQTLVGVQGNDRSGSGSRCQQWHLVGVTDRHVFGRRWIAVAASAAQNPGYSFETTCSHRLMVRTLAFQSGNESSILSGSTS